MWYCNPLWRTWFQMQNLHGIRYSADSEYTNICLYIIHAQCGTSLVLPYIIIYHFPTLNFHNEVFSLFRVQAYRIGFSLSLRLIVLLFFFSPWSLTMPLLLSFPPSRSCFCLHTSCLSVHCIFKVITRVYSRFGRFYLFKPIAIFSVLIHSKCYTSAKCLITNA